MWASESSACLAPPPTVAVLWRMVTVLPSFSIVMLSADSCVGRLRITTRTGCLLMAASAATAGLRAETANAMFGGVYSGRLSADAQASR